MTRTARVPHPSVDQRRARGREAMAGFAAMGTMEVWYARLAEDDVPRALRAAEHRPARDLEATYGIPPAKMQRLLREQFGAYRATLRDDRR